MTATVLPFPPRAVGSIADLARAADERWPDINAPMVGVAIEMLDQDPGEFRANVRTVLDQGAVGLLAKTDQAMAETVADLSLMVEAIGLARRKLRAAGLARMEEDNG